MKNKFISLIIILSLSISSLWSQNIQDYLVVTFVRERNKDNHKEKSYYWILELDSVKSNDYNIYPLYLESYSNNDIVDCCNNEAISIFTITTDTNYDFIEGYLTEIDRLKALISTNKKKVQDLTKKWKERYKESVEIYITPIKGSFCKCSVTKESIKKINENAIVFLPNPTTKFEINKDFWETEVSRQITFFDFAIVDYVNTPD